MLSKNQIAPNFKTLNQTNEIIDLAAFKTKKNIVLYFYPKDDTPGCTIEANDFTSLATEFDQLDTVILGVSKDTCNSHQDFIAKFGLKIDLLADTEGKVCADYDVWQEKEKNGIKKMAILRSTFIIDKQGLIQAAHYGVNHVGHAQAILEEIKSL